MRIVECESDVIVSAEGYAALLASQSELEALKDKIEARKLSRRPYNRRYMRGYMQRRREAEKVAGQG